jgi:4-diphosphocytidyl-2-C-methyl-D-erythritol kinase
MRTLAPAKLTRSLRVTGVRDDGYHLIDAEMVTLDLADTLTISAGAAGITVGGPFADGVPTDRTNLVARALEAVGRRAAVHIDKQIPHGGGLGGGSSDAAAVLRWAGHDDPTAAAALGADVPFCVVGGRARVRGIGR